MSRDAAGRPRTPLWNWRRQLAGNLLPMALAAVPMAEGLRIALRTGDTTGAALHWVAGSCVVAWLGANFFGLAGNGSLRREVGRSIPHPRTAWFVGHAPSGSWGLLDPHEDVGFLYWTEDRIVYSGERNQVVLPRGSVRRVRFRANPHTWALLGGWVSVEGTVDGRAARMLVEPRERPTLLGNFLAARRLIRELRLWAAGQGARPTSAVSR
ncbi:MAG: hypothetical protein N2109_11980 [Fimbriimonadales bacterium]|nr:hypothetical protein [Fimbriimonadales bacterium]